MPRQMLVPVSSFAALFAIGHVGRRGYRDKQRPSVDEHFAPLPHADGAQCVSVNGRLRYHHTPDKDGRCVFCPKKVNE